MPRGRDRGFLDGLELWRRPHTTTSKAAHSAYVAIAHIFELIDRAMLHEMQEDIQRHEMQEDIQRRSSNSIFSVTRYQKDLRSYMEDVKKATSHTSSEASTFAYLTDTRCVAAWSRVHSAILEHQGRSDQQYLTPWTQAKARAHEILNLAEAVLDYYDSDECQDLVIPGREGVGAGIEIKLRTLSLFDNIYSRPTYEAVKINSSPLTHPFILKFNRFHIARTQKTGARSKEGYARTHQIVSNRSARPRPSYPCCKLILGTIRKA